MPEIGEKIEIPLTLLGRSVTVPGIVLDPVNSAHTDRGLKRLDINFRVAGAETDALNSQLVKAREPEAPLPGNGVAWLVKSHSHSHRQGDSVHSYSLEIEEVEELNATELQFLGFELKPSRYKEDADDDNILISAIVDPTPEQSEEIDRLIHEQISSDAHNYFPLVRVGISEAPLNVRFGRCLWQRVDTGARHLLRLVSERGDDQDREYIFENLHQPEFGVTVKKVARTERILEALLKQLETGGEVDATALRNIADGEDPAAPNRDFDEAADLANHF